MTTTEIAMMSKAEKDAIVKLALGRIFLLGSRPTQPGDVETYEACRAIILAATDPAVPTWTPNYARDRHCGASGG